MKSRLFAATAVVSATLAATPWTRAPNRATAGEGVSDARRTAIVAATAKVAPGVVSVTVTKARRLVRRSPFFDDPFFDMFLFGSPREQWESVSSVGSGVVVHPKGYIVTNSHVVQSRARETRMDIVVHLSDGREFPAELVGMDANNDIAVMKVNGANLPVAALQASQAENLIGEWVVAVGNPFGYLMSDSKPTVTVGVNSAVRRNFTLASGMGFAIPIQKAMRVVEELINYGYIRRWTTGIYADQRRLRGERGVRVSKVEKNSPGHKAGLRAGDSILAADGMRVENLLEFMEILRRFQVGEKVEILYSRNGVEMRTEMILEENKSGSRP